MTTFGYMRANYPIQTAKQINLFNGFECDDVRIDEENITVDTELNCLLEELHECDTLIVPSILTFGKSLNNLAPIMIFLQKKAISLILIEEKLVVSQESLFYYQFSVLNNADSCIRSTLSKQGVQKRESEGSALGRPRITEDKIEKIQQLYIHEKKRIREIALECDVSIGTAHKYIKLAKEMVMEVQ